MFPGETVVTGAPNPGTDPEIMSTPAGFYIGYRDEHGLPYSRETDYTTERGTAEIWLDIFKLAIEVSTDLVAALSFVRR